MKKATIIIALFYSLQCYGQMLNRTNYLLLGEYQRDSASGQIQHLVRYTFTDGILIFKDTILSTQTFKEQYGTRIGYEWGENIIYKNRYIISSMGNVIDVHTQSLVIETNDKFIEARGDSLIFYRNNIFTGRGYLICDLKNKTYDFVKDKNFYAVEGLQSPNHKMGLTIDQSKIPYKIVLHTSDNNTVILREDCGSGTLMALIASLRTSVPLLWIDNEHFLYSISERFQIDTIMGTGDYIYNTLAKIYIYKMDIESGLSDIVCMIDSVPPSLSGEYFYFNNDEDVIFMCQKGRYLIDLNERKNTEYLIAPVGNDFKISFPDSEGSRIEYKSKELGVIWCNISSAKTTNGFIAVDYGEVGSNHAYPKGVKVWNNITETWTTIDVEGGISGMIGWIEY